jgi:hypothetical protein
MCNPVSVDLLSWALWDLLVEGPTTAIPKDPFPGNR